jgi:hypothetical protein
MLRNREPKRRKMPVIFLSDCRLLYPSLILIIGQRARLAHLHSRLHGWIVMASDQDLCFDTSWIHPPSWWQEILVNDRGLFPDCPWLQDTTSAKHFEKWKEEGYLAWHRMAIRFEMFFPHNNCRKTQSREFYFKILSSTGNDRETLSCNGGFHRPNVKWRWKTRGNCQVKSSRPPLILFVRLESRSWPIPKSETTLEETSSQV